MLAPDVRAELRTLSRPQAGTVARHLVAAGRFVDSDPALALRHAREARRMAARIGAVREAVGIAAYHASEWSEALTELRAAFRLTGDPVHLPLMADCERAMGRPERALRVAQSPDVGRLDRAGRVELAIVEAGARRDMQEADAALMVLQGAGLDRSRVLPWSARLWYAYADSLLAAGRHDEAADWFLAVAGVDPDDQTDAEDRLVELGVLEPPDVEEAEPDPSDVEEAELDPKLLLPLGDPERLEPPEIDEARLDPDVRGGLAEESPGDSHDAGDHLPDGGARKEQDDGEQQPHDRADREATGNHPALPVHPAVFREAPASAQHPSVPPPTDNSLD
jgi:tetratricopeptide (TPR) repeat protein